MNYKKQVKNNQVCQFNNRESDKSVIQYSGKSFLNGSLKGEGIYSYFFHLVM